MKAGQEVAEREDVGPLWALWLVLCLWAFPAFYFQRAEMELHCMDK